MRLTLKQYKTSGVLVNKYNPLHNLLSGASGHKELKDFTTKALSIVPQEAVDITCQPSYDGTTNLIINDDRTIPKIINSKFTKLEGNRFKVVERNQKNQTNIYDEEHLDNDTSLFLTSTKFPKVLLYNVNYSGQLKGGNYTFYFKYVDDDFNETPIIAESGQVCVFKGTLSNLCNLRWYCDTGKRSTFIKCFISNCCDILSDGLTWILRINACKYIMFAIQAILLELALMNTRKSFNRLTSRTIRLIL